MPQKSSRGGARKGTGRTKSNRVTAKLDARAAPVEELPFDPEPPPGLNEGGAERWDRLIAEHGGPQWFRQEDRTTLEMAAKLLERTDSGVAKCGDYTVLRSCVGDISRRVRKRREAAAGRKAEPDPASPFLPPKQTNPFDAF